MLNQPTTPPTNGIVVDQQLLPAQATQFMQKIQTSHFFKEFTVNNGHLTLTSPLYVLQTKYQLSDTEILMVQSILTYDQQRPLYSAPSTYPDSVSPEISVRGTVIYFTYDDSVSFLTVAASIGPYAMLGALDSIATLFGGPIGTAIGTILGIIGFPSLLQLCYLVLQAEVEHKGVWMGFTSWIPFPNYEQGLW